MWNAPLICKEGVAFNRLKNSDFRMKTAKKLVFSRMIRILRTNG
jgi:hypothetical protein